MNIYKSCMAWYVSGFDDPSEAKERYRVSVASEKAWRAFENETNIPCHA